jgi:hypothetical protein
MVEPAGVHRRISDDGAPSRGHASRLFRAPAFFVSFVSGRAL